MTEKHYFRMYTRKPCLYMSTKVSKIAKLENLLTKKFVSLNQHWFREHFCIPSPENRTKTTQEVIGMFGLPRKKLSVCLIFTRF